MQQRAGMRGVYLMAFAAIVLWSTNPAVSKLALGGMSSVELLCYSSAVAALVLAVYAAFSGVWRDAFKYTLRDYVELALIGLGPNMVCYLLTYESLTLLPAHIANIINYLWPILTVVFAALILGERFSAATMVALVMSFAGVAFVMLALGGGQGLSDSQFLGVVLIACAAVLYGLFNVLNKRHGGSQVINMIVYFGASALAMAPVVAFQGASAPEPVAVTSMLWVGVLVNAVGYVLWFTALQQSPSAILANMAYAAPVLSLGVSYVLLGEHIAWEACFGLLLIIAGFLMQAWITWRRSHGEWLTRSTPGPLPASLYAWWKLHFKKSEKRG